MPLGMTIGVDGLASTSARVAALRQAAAWQGRSEERIAKTHTAAMRDVTAAYKEELRRDVIAGGFVNGSKLSKTWRGQVYPPGGKSSLAPAGYIWTKAGIIIDAFTLGVTITARNSRYLAIPQGRAKAIVRRLNSAVAKSGHFEDQGSYVRRVADALGVKKLEVRIDHQTGRGVIVAPGRKLTKRGLASKQRGDDTVLFALVRSATLKRRIRGRALLDDFSRRFPADFAAAVERHAEDVE